ncbi:MAG: hypothetical protein CMK83_07455 [Pseudomonadales bacterium]|jgi:hypothetical protein|uniref:hypothetical protein n=1 Tax=unclassified Ketobacter TaxID=2639109 RepID=UPI000C8EFC2A|nr:MULTISPECIES: hypothetical protein [unclassified Ketobacter]MAA59797.1 hypothetical protein [Pseudomonadales bacterium]MEC8813891.1 hypothetical protein [Pseudomonadota bacterium]TNC90904.1 MAG: hypothetical protein CSH49_01015 [Alcanivorax sp.]HAG94777.1 hypothetical protein [Gammaproteobacteria bacterium]MAQ24043.1 hypothetical protein [Pseudomonadales bacterium]|tara:strand:+ start:315 stop:626 length:312 start_codon:yes stop_codon:yes gene_type:complete
MELTEQLIGDCSPYIGNLVYDIDVRLVFVELLDGPESQNLKRRIVFPGIVSFHETNLLNQPEDDSIDDVVSIQRLDTNRLILTTYKKEILLNLTEEPFVEVID